MNEYCTQLPTLVGQGSTTTLNLSNAVTYDPFNQHSYISAVDPHVAKQDRKDQLNEMESLSRIFKNLKESNVEEDILKPIEDTIKRLTAELFYLKD